VIRHRQVGVGWSRPRPVGRLPLVLWLTCGWSALELCGLGCMPFVGGVWLGRFCLRNGVVIVLREGRAVGVIFSRHVVGSHRLCRGTTLAVPPWVVTGVSWCLLWGFCCVVGRAGLLGGRRWGHRPPCFRAMGPCSPPSLHFTLIKHPFISLLKNVRKLIVYALIWYVRMWCDVNY
jgi:hypothetical protein